MHKVYVPIDIRYSFSCGSHTSGSPQAWDEKLSSLCTHWTYREIEAAIHLRLADLCNMLGTAKPATVTLRTVPALRCRSERCWIVAHLWLVHKGDGGWRISASLRGLCGWNSAIERRSWVWVRSLVLFPLLPFPSELWVPYGLLNKFTPAHKHSLNSVQYSCRRSTGWIGGPLPNGGTRSDEGRSREGSG